MFNDESIHRGMAGRNDSNGNATYYNSGKWKIIGDE